MRHEDPLLLGNHFFFLNSSNFYPSLRSTDHHIDGEMRLNKLCRFVRSEAISLEYHLLLSLDKNHATRNNLAPAVETLKAHRQQHSQLSSMEYRYS